MAFNDFLSLFRSYFVQQDRIERFLYNFHEPFDKEKALKDAKYGGKAKLTSVQLIYFELILFDCLLEILDTCFSPYKSYNNSFVQPTEEIAKLFYYCNRYIKDIEAHPQYPFSNFYRINLSSFYAIKGDYSRLIKHWNEQQGQLKDHREKLNNFLMANDTTEFPIPFRLQHLITLVKESMKHQKELQSHPNSRTINDNDAVKNLPIDFQWDIKNKFLYHFGEFGVIDIRGKRYELFKTVANKNGDWAEVKSMEQYTGKGTRTVLNQIDERIRKATNNKVGFIPRKTGIGAYRLALL